MIDTLEKLLRAMAAHGATKFYAKKLAPNDNSKNQVYLGGDYSALNILPFGRVETDSDSKAGSKRDRAKAWLSFYWLDENGIHGAPEAKLILYPKYPEVRLSGFLKRSKRAPSAIMRRRDDGRTLFLGTTPDGRVLAHSVMPGSALRNELDALGSPPQEGVFIELSVDARAVGDTRGQLLAALRAIHAKAWIASQRMGPGGLAVPYVAANGGGYTLEAELGISPNGYAEPDYLGWEVKQYAVNDFVANIAQNPVTLLTPEPTGGIYRDEGVEVFIRRFGYPDQRGREDRLNFGGIYKVGAPVNVNTGVRLHLLGFDEEKKVITDMTQGIALLSGDGTPAAIWNFSGILEHWNRKHAKTVYIPSIKRGPPMEYAYGDLVQLCVGTDFDMFLQALAAGAIYYDPGLKLEDINSARPRAKRRSQFRIRHSDLNRLYHQIEETRLIL